MSGGHGMMGVCVFMCRAMCVCMKGECRVGLEGERPCRSNSGLIKCRACLWVIAVALALATSSPDIICPVGPRFLYLLLSHFQSEVADLFLPFTTNLHLMLFVHLCPLHFHLQCKQKDFIYILFANSSKTQASCTCY